MRARPSPVKHGLTQEDLVRHAAPRCGGAPVTSDGSRSHGKHRTYFLTDVRGPLRAGSDDTTRWKTYVHAYPNDHGGVTLQYWRFYAYNDAFNDHGGDWEGLHVVLGRDREVEGVRLLGHSSMKDARAGRARMGRHALRRLLGGRRHAATRATRRWESWRAAASIASSAWSRSTTLRASCGKRRGSAGASRGRAAQVTPGGGLVNVGEKSAP